MRERIDGLVDRDSFREHAPIAGASELGPDGALESFSPSSVVTGTALVEGRRVVVCGDDFTIRGAAYSAVGLKKGLYADALAVRRRVPLVGQDEQRAEAWRKVLAEHGIAVAEGEAEGFWERQLPLLLAWSRQRAAEALSTPDRRVPPTHPWSSFPPSPFVCEGRRRLDGQREQQESSSHRRPIWEAAWGCRPRGRRDDDRRAARARRRWGLRRRPLDS